MEMHKLLRYHLGSAEGAKGVSVKSLRCVVAQERKRKSWTSKSRALLNLTRLHTGQFLVYGQPRAVSLAFIIGSSETRP